MRKHKILLVRIDAIGDFILWLDAANGIRNLYPADQYELILLGNNLWTSLAKASGLFDQVLSLHIELFTHRILYRLWTVFTLKCWGFDQAVYPTYSRTPMADYIVKMSGARERIGFDGDLSNMSAEEKEKGDRWYTRLLPATPGQKMELLRNAEFLRRLGLENFRASLPTLTYSNHRQPVSKDYFVIIPGAGWTRRQWPLHRFVEVIDKVHSFSGLQPVLCGGPGEESLGKYIRDNAGTVVEDLTGRTSLAEMASIIAGARFLVGNETGAMHIAVALATPTVCILGGGHFGRFLPYKIESTPVSRPLPKAVWYKMDCFGCNWNCRYRPRDDASPLPCIEGITVEAALAEISRVLSEVDAKRKITLG